MQEKGHLICPHHRWAEATDTCLCYHCCSRWQLRSYHLPKVILLVRAGPGFVPGFGLLLQSHTQIAFRATGSAVDWRWEEVVASPNLNPQNLAFWLGPQSFSPSLISLACLFMCLFSTMNTCDCIDLGIGTIPVKLHLPVCTSPIPTPVTPNQGTPKLDFVFLIPLPVISIPNCSILVYRKQQTFVY